MPSTSTPATRKPVETYYSLFSLKAKASTKEMEIAFRRYVARYRPTITVEQVFTDPQFRKRVHAYLTLTGPLRVRHDALTAGGVGRGPLPTPLDDLSASARTLLMARVAMWRREHVDGIHLLRALLAGEPQNAEAWALLGEFFLEIDRLEEGLRAYEQAVAVAPDHPRYADRLQHVRDVLEGTVELALELSPEEELLAEERHRYRRSMMALVLMGLGLLAMAFLRPINPMPGALHVPWTTVAIQAGGVFFLLLGLAHGRLLQPFEHSMLWSSLQAGDRGRTRNYPYALLFAVTAVPSLWLAVITLIIMAVMDEEWPTSASIMMGICLLINIGLTVLVAVTMQGHWTGTLLVGGNALVFAAMLGWWLGSLGTGDYA